MWVPHAGTLRKKEHAEFCESWLTFDPDLNFTIESGRLPMLMKHMYPPLGLAGTKKSKRAVHRLCAAMDLPDRNGVLSCTDVYKGFVRRYGQLYGKVDPDKEKKEQAEAKQKAEMAGTFAFK